MRMISRREAKVSKSQKSHAKKEREKITKTKKYINHHEKS